MTPRRLLGAATAVLLTGTTLGAVPADAADDNARSRWDGRRVVQTPGSADGAVHVLSNRGRMVTVVRELGAGSDVWRIRESRDGGLGFSARLDGPRDVERFRYDESQAQDTTYAAYEHDGRLWAVEADARRAIVLTLRRDLAPAAAEAPKVAAGEGSADNGLVTQGGTWHQHVGPVGGADPETTPNDGGVGSSWASYPDPNVDGVAGNAGEDYAFAGSGHLLVFWNAPTGDLMVVRRAAQDTAAAFSAPQTVAADEQYVDFVETAKGGRLVTQAPDGVVSIYTYTADAAGFSFDGKRVLAEAWTPAPKPQVLVDALGTLTVGWRAPSVDGGLVLWQEDRPGSAFLESPRVVKGSRGDEGVRIVVSPRGSITAAWEKAPQAGSTSGGLPVVVRHLPAGADNWTRVHRLISPKPVETTADDLAGFALGSPRRDGDLRLAVNDTVGVYGFRFDAPRPYTKMTKPVRTVQRDGSYRIGWNTSWTFADDWQVRMRLDKGKRYGAWRSVSVPEGGTSKVVDRPRGRTWCYAARAVRGGQNVTGWSEQRCVTVRR